MNEKHPNRKKDKHNPYTLLKMGGVLCKILK